MLRRYGVSLTQPLLWFLFCGLFACSFGKQQAEQDESEAVQVSDEEDAAELAEEQQGNQENIASEEDVNVNEGNLNDIINQAIQQNAEQGENLDQQVVIEEGEADAMALPKQLSSPGTVAGIAGVSAGQGLPEMGSRLPYIVMKGDTLAKIATQIYGTYKMWKELAALSEIETPNLIYPGDIVYYQLTDATIKFASVYENQPKQEVVVKEGDTLASISDEFYGKGEHWKLVWRQNSQIVNPDVIFAGSVLYLKPLHQLKSFGQYSELSSYSQNFDKKVFAKKRKA